MRALAAQTDHHPHRGHGRRTRTKMSEHGHYVRAAHPSRRLRAMSELAFDATIRAAAIRQGLSANSSHSVRLAIKQPDLRQKVRETRIGNLILFVMDVSASMSLKKRIKAVKGAVLSLLLDAYQKRDQVGLIAFGGKQAQLVLPPTNSIDIAQKLLVEMPAGGSTPLAHGLVLAENVLRKYRNKEELVPLLVLLSDCRANVKIPNLPGNALKQAKLMASQIAEMEISSLVIDCETVYLRLGLAQGIADQLGGEYLQLDELEADKLVASVRRATA